MRGGSWANSNFLRAVPETMESMMWFLALGLLLMLLKWLEFGPVAEWAWWQTMIPLGLAIVWWTWADLSGYTKRKRMEKDAKRHDDRIQRLKKNMGQIQRPK
ncbi:TIGR04438 family Trp-rich protein [Hydrogenophaga atypica]|uniref:TIGR04438 family Trp-rich protein n=1 Tax=Hydrogenophaga atypica TaxID=249409 RepID=A0ABW2QJI7_9BURK